MHEFNAVMLIASLFLFSTLAGAAPGVKIEKAPYKGWSNCYRMTNGQIELILTSDVGPRIIRFGFVGEENEFKEYADQVGKTGGSEWRIYGGHRLWHAPELRPRSYAPDNSPIEVRAGDGRLHAIQPVEETTGIQKEIEIRMAPDTAQVEVVHRLRNKNAWAIEIAPWSISVLAQGGPGHRSDAPARQAHRDGGTNAPAGVVGLYRFSRPTLDPGLQVHHPAAGPWGRSAEGRAPRSRMAGQPTCATGHLFVKKFDAVKGATYPDFGQLGGDLHQRRHARTGDSEPARHTRPGSYRGTHRALVAPQGGSTGKLGRGGH